MNKTKIFFIFGIFINALFLVITFIFFFFLKSPLMSSSNIDYLTFYNAGLIVINDLPNLYNSSLYLFPFRYFPISAYFFTPFSLLGLKLGFFVFQIFNFILNLITVYLIYKIIQLYMNTNRKMTLSYKVNNLKNLFYDLDNEPILHHFGIFLIMLPQFMNYFLGQINVIVSFFILISLFFFLKDKVKFDFIGGISLGLAIVFKPSLIIILPFIIFLNYDNIAKKLVFKFKRTILRLFGTILLLILSGVLFIIHPRMIGDFIEVNLTGEYTFNVGEGLKINPSFSLTRIILTLFQILGMNVNYFLVFILITLIFLLPLYLLFIYFRNQQNKLIIGYFSGIVIMLLVYFDSWPHHIVVLAPFLVLFVLLEKDFELYIFFKYIYYLISFLILIFWIIFYLTYNIFPFNIGGLVLMILLYYSVLIYYLNQVK